MDKDYIARNDALEIVKRTSGDYVAAFSMIKKLPSANVNEVVRCKDCIHHNNCEIEVTGQLSDNSFCCRGERKGGTHMDNRTS